MAKVGMKPPASAFKKLCRHLKDMLTGAGNGAVPQIRWQQGQFWRQGCRRDDTMPEDDSPQTYVASHGCARPTHHLPGPRKPGFRERFQKTITNPGCPCLLPITLKEHAGAAGSVSPSPAGHGDAGMGVEMLRGGWRRTAHNVISQNFCPHGLRWHGV